MKRQIQALFLLACGLFVGLTENGFATTIKQVTPAGIVSNVRQITAVFSNPVVTVGDPNSEDPFNVSCDAKGAGRWLDDKRWVYDFNDPIPVGSNCTISLRKDFAPIQGGAVTGQTEFSFSTGGPFPWRIVPYTSQYRHSRTTIEEDEIFALSLNGEAEEASIRKNVWCEVNSVKEKIPVKIITGEDRKKILPLLAPTRYPERLVLLQCGRTLPAGKKMSLIWGEGVLSKATKIANTQPKRFDYQVRKPFTIKIECERENAKSGCIPIRPINVHFSAPVSLDIARRIHLKTPTGIKKPNAIGKTDPIETLSFSPPFEEKATLTFELPSDFQDQSGRSPSNTSSQLQIKTGLMPSLAKFPGNFGILEVKEGGVLPITLRNIESPKDGHISAKVTQVRVSNDDAQMLNWYQKSREFDDRWTKTETLDDGTRVKYDPRSRSIVGDLASKEEVKRYSLPKSLGSKVTEVIGLPLKEPGFYIVEVESQLLGEALLKDSKPMYVRTSALVTNMVVHLKQGRMNGLVWVTSLDQGKPISQATVTINNCKGKAVWQGETNDTGLVFIPTDVQGLVNADEECSAYDEYFVVATKGKDLSFVSSYWTNGIEPWRFNIRNGSYYSRYYRDDSSSRIQAVLDRTLFKAGETVSGKIFYRKVVANGGTTQLKIPEEKPDNDVVVEHWESDERTSVTVSWDNLGRGIFTYNIPPDAKLGRYSLKIGSQTVGTFYVSDFRLPILTGQLSLFNKEAGASSFPLALQLNYLSGGPASNYPVEVSAILEHHYLRFEGYEDYNFDYDEALLKPSQHSSRDLEGYEGEGEYEDGYRDYDSDESLNKLILDKQKVTLDDQGTAKIQIDGIEHYKTPRSLVTEMMFRDPNGEAQTISTVETLWPTDVVVGIATEDSWIRRDAGHIPVKMVTLDHSGRPKGDTKVVVTAFQATEYAHRKRVLGAFYSYESYRDVKKIGDVCEGRTDKWGRLTCQVAISDAQGDIILRATATDTRKRSSYALTSVWVSSNDNWFYTEAQDRIDVFPEKQHYEAGENATFQVRMPFRKATALIAVEREGIMRTYVRELSGSEPHFEIPILEEDGPNVFVSVLAIRGRVDKITWETFFEWGWKSPVQWFKAWRAEPKEPITAMVDLAKPAYKFGIAEISVGQKNRALNVSITTDKPEYRIEDTVKASVEVRLPDGKVPPEGTEVVVVAIDQALLELKNNDTWNLLDSMYPKHAYEVWTATAQMQVIGKRHYGRKAIPTGGGGGFVMGEGRIRENFDPLLIWSPRVVLDKKGKAEVEIPLNDSLTTFTLVAVADVGAGFFGTGKTQIRSMQELQLFSGISPIIREGDKQVATVTVRNATAKDMKVDVKATAVIEYENRTEDRVFSVQTIHVPAGQSQEAQWIVEAPEFAKQIDWHIDGIEKALALQDQLKVSQNVLVVTPLTVRQSILTRIDEVKQWNVVNPENALPGRSQIQIGLSTTIGGNLSALRRYFEEYPYRCLEQQSSIAVGLSDQARWEAIMKNLGNYIDDNGLLRYYPSDYSYGSVALTAHIMLLAAETGWAIPEKSLDKLKGALKNYVQGRLRAPRYFYSNEREELKVLSIHALARYQAATPEMLESIKVDLNTWPTSAILDWVSILTRVPSIPDAAAKLIAADNVLRNRLVMQGTRTHFRTEGNDERWSTMANGDTNAIKLAMMAMQRKEWKEDLPNLILGAVSRQRRGTWSTTTANTWGVLMLEKTGTMQSVQSMGLTVAKLGSQQSSFDWKNAKEGDITLSWGDRPQGKKEPLELKQEGQGKPWATIQTLAAVPVTQPVSNGYYLTREIIPISQKVSGQWSRGDQMRVRITVKPTGQTGSVVLSDPIPAGAKILGSGLGRESRIENTRSGANGGASLSFEEKRVDRYVAYFDWVYGHEFSVEYVIQLNTTGEFNMPPTRMEALYAPEIFAELPNTTIVVQP